MKYGIFDNENKRFLIVSDDLKHLIQTIEKHMPQFRIEDVEEYADDEVSCGCDGCYYLTKEMPESPVTVESVQALRRQYRLEHCDYLTLEKIRREALGCWSEDDEAAYVENMQHVEDFIAQNLPYPN